MKSITIFITVSFLALAGCLSQTPPSSSAPVTSQPVADPTATALGTFIADAKKIIAGYQVIVFLDPKLDNPKWDTDIKAAQAAFTVVQSEPAGTPAYQTAMNAILAMKAEISGTTATTQASK